MRKGKDIEAKKKQVAELVSLMEKSKSIGIVNLENLPAKQLKSVRAKLRDNVNFVFAKKTLVKRALEGSKRKEAKDLLPKLENINPVLIFSDLDAFALFKELKASRQWVPAKPGQTSPSDIWINAGPTPFAPGPAISELASLGLKTKVEGGKIHVREDAKVVKQGDKISGPAASILAKLGVTPMQIGVTITHVLENTDLYTGAVLDIDVEKYAQDLKTAALNALTLAIELGIVTKETAPVMVQKAYRESKAVEAALQKPAEAAS